VRIQREPGNEVHKNAVAVVKETNSCYGKFLVGNPRSWLIVHEAGVRQTKDRFILQGSALTVIRYGLELLAKLNFMATNFCATGSKI